MFPMAGTGARFRDAGYAEAKYSLPLGRSTIFENVVAGFASRFDCETFLFVSRPGVGANEFVTNACSRLGVIDAMVVELPAGTRGQAETVARGVDRVGISGDEPLMIFNIDTVRTASIPVPVGGDRYAGLVEVFPAAGDHWSFVDPHPDGLHVLRTTEKRRISDLCCTGLYAFASVSLFLEALRAEELEGRWEKELYVAPLYNHLIRQGLQVEYSSVEACDIVCAGTPLEYEAARTRFI